jgi:hypothetical protein
MAARCPASHTVPAKALYLRPLWEKHWGMLTRWFIVGLMLAVLGGCAKPPDLPETVVAAATPADFTRFRAELGARFPADRLADFDTAIKELQLDAMSRLPTAAERETDMLRVATGKPVHAVTVLGWQARRARFLREIADLDGMLQRDLQQQARTAATGTPDAVLRRIGSEREVLAQLHQNLAATDARLASLEGTAP